MLETEAKLSQHLAMAKASTDLMGPHLARLLGPLVQSYVVFDVSRSRLIPDTLDHLAMHSPADLKRPLKVDHFTAFLPLFQAFYYLLTIWIDAFSVYNKIPNIHFNDISVSEMLPLTSS